MQTKFNERFFKLCLQTHVQRAAAFLIVSIFVVFYFQLLNVANRPYGNDFNAYTSAAQALLQNKSPYQIDSPFGYIYPPVFAFFLIPLSSSAIPVWVSQGIWYILNIVALYFIVSIFLGLYAQIRLSSQHLFPALLLLVLFGPVLQANAMDGQANLIYLFFMTLCIKKYDESKPLLVALFLALAISIKVVPAILLLYFGFRKEFKILFFTVVIFLVFSLLPYVLVGNNLFEFYREFFLRVANRSVKEFALASDNFHLAHLLSLSWPPLAAWPFTPRLSQLLVGLFLFATETIAARKKIANRNSWIYALYLACIPLLSPVSHKHHLVVLIPAAMVMSFGCLVQDKWRPIRMTFAITFGFSMLFLYQLVPYNYYKASLAVGILSLIIVTVWTGFFETKFWSSDRHPNSTVVRNSGGRKNKFVPKLIIPTVFVSLFVAFALPMLWRSLHGNFYTVIDHRVYRCGQLTTAQWDQHVEKHQIKSVISLRGNRSDEGWSPEEEAAVKKHGLVFAYIDLTPKHLPRRQDIVNLLDCLQTFPQPILIHCRNGLNRSGFASVAAAMVLGGQKFDAARRQLSLRYGYLSLGRQSAQIGRFYDQFESYLKKQKLEGTPNEFEQWGRTIYFPSIYGARIEVWDFPSNVQVGKGYGFRARITNISTGRWNVQKPETLVGVKPAFTIRHVSAIGEKLDWPKICKTYLFDKIVNSKDWIEPTRIDMGTGILEPGAYRDIDVSFVAPTVTGIYLFKMEMVDEYVTWFEKKGSVSMMKKLTVERG